MGAVTLHGAQVTLLPELQTLWCLGLRACLQRPLPPCSWPMTVPRGVSVHRAPQGAHG